MRTSIRLSAMLAALALAGCAQPAPPPPSPPVTDRTFLIFFDWDQAALTPRSQQIVAEFLRLRVRPELTRIELQGHADRSGSAAYNMRLSQRRAEAVAAELKRLGIDPALFRIMPFGESRPLIPTADGVQEPQNRRVEMIDR